MISNNNNSKVFNNIILPKNIKYNGIQEGISFNLFLFTELKTGSTFAIRKEEREVTVKMIERRSKEVIASFTLI